MGYTRIVQYGNITELYEYEKNKPDYRPRYISSLDKKRQKQARLRKKALGLTTRSTRSIKRSRTSFFRFCHANNVAAKTVSFLTLTFSHDVTYKQALKSQSDFFQRLKKNIPSIPLSHISVPEKTKKGRFHFHILIYNLPPEIQESERSTRNIQRCFNRGYVDLRPSTYTSEGIAGYMAKYMAKALSNPLFETTRGYNNSRNIIKPSAYGRNTLGGYLDLIIPDEGDRQQTEYDVPYLGRCIKTVIKTNI